MTTSQTSTAHPASERTAMMTDRVIMDQIPAGARVLDLGCGDGRLLCRLRDETGASVQGIERDLTQVVATIAKGVPVIQADLDRGLRDIPDGSFDFAVLSQTLQQVLQPEAILREMLRVARRSIVVVPNFGHWRIRLQVLIHGRTPVTNSLPYDWYNTPNLHFMSMTDFRALTNKLQMRIVRELPILHGRPLPDMRGPNWRADSALYVLERA